MSYLKNYTNKANNIKIEKQDGTVSIINAIYKHAITTPNKVALDNGKKNLSYYELCCIVENISRIIKESGVNKNDVIAVLANRSIEFVVAILSIIKVGAVYVPIDPEYPIERIKFMINDSKAALILYQEGYEELFEKDACSIQIKYSYDSDFKNSISEMQCGYGEHIYMIYTSGTTGNPKGSMIKMQSFTNLLNWYIEELNLSSKDRMLLVASTSFDLAQKNIFASLMVGAELFLYPSSNFDIRGMDKLIYNYEISSINCTPSLFSLLLQLCEEEEYKMLSSLRNVVLGGEPININKLIHWHESKNFHCTIFNTYGPTECTDIATCYRLSESDYVEGKKIPLGKPISNVELYILDDSLNCANKGELYIGGMGVSSGYYFQPEKTKEKFTTINSLSKNIIYSSGDLVEKDCNTGELYYVGRKDQQVKIRGYRVELSGIEDILKGIKNIEDAIIVYKEANDRLVAFVTSNMEVDIIELKKHLKTVMPSYMIPSQIIQVNEFPLTPNKKVDRKELVRMSLYTGKTNFTNSTQEIVAGIWNKLIGNDLLTDEEQSFYDCGADSLLILAFVIEIEKYFNVQLSNTDFMNYSTLKSLSEFIITETNIIELENVNDKICEKYGNANFLSKFNDGNEEVIILHHDGREKEILDYIEANFESYLYPNYLLNSLLEKQFTFKVLTTEENQKIINGLNSENNLINFNYDVEMISRIGTKLNEICKEAVNNVRRLFIDVDINVCCTCNDKVRRVMNKLYEEQDVFRTVISFIDGEYVFKRYSKICTFNNVIDLTSFNNQEKKLIINEIREEIEKYKREHSYLNSSLFRLQILRLDHKNIKVIGYIDSIVADIQTDRIIKSYFLKPEDEIINRMSMYEYFNLCYFTNTKDIYSSFIKSRYYKDFKDAIEAFYNTNPNYLNNVYLNTEIIELSICGNQHKNVFKLVYELTVAFICSIFSITIVPLRIYTNNRKFPNKTFENTIGNFLDCIITTARLRDNNYEAYLREKEYFSNTYMGLKSFIKEKDVQEIIYRKCPFILNYLGFLSEADKKRTITDAHNIKHLKYPIEAFSSDKNFLVFIFHNGLNNPSLIENALKDFEGVNISNHFKKF